MSLGYALAIHHRRRDGTDVSKFLAIFAALVPGDILAAHGVILSITTQSDAGKVSIVFPHALALAFVGLIVASILLFAAFHGPDWEPKDAGRIFIAPAAFVGWTMLQRPSAFDAAYGFVFPAPAPCWPLRSVWAVLLALGLVAAARALDFKPAPGGKHST